MYTPKIGIVLSDDEKAEWLAAAKARRLTLSALIRQAVRKEIGQDSPSICPPGHHCEHITNKWQEHDHKCCHCSYVHKGTTESTEPDWKSMPKRMFEIKAREDLLLDKSP